MLADLTKPDIYNLINFEFISLPNILILELFISILSTSTSLTLNILISGDVSLKNKLVRGNKDI